jgi:hypothetical protein
VVHGGDDRIAERPRICYPKQSVPSPDDRRSSSVASVSAFEQNERDYEQLTTAVKSGRITAPTGL